MLAKPNRLVSAEDFRGTVRRGRRTASVGLVTYLARRNDAGPIRFGFIVSSAVGNAVTRNRVRRRLRAASSEFVRHNRGCGVDVVVRARPEVAAYSWPNLRQELSAALELQLSRASGMRTTRKERPD